SVLTIPSCFGIQSPSFPLMVFQHNLRYVHPSQHKGTISLDATVDQIYERFAFRLNFQLSVLEIAELTMTWMPLRHVQGYHESLSCILLQ
ncbi:MAG: hypothetical protein OIF47_03295, partial [Marinibacterium sp.]|nr:hypothetical protein [Marinibacterium sp.]